MAKREELVVAKLCSFVGFRSDLRSNWPNLSSINCICNVDAE